jgi:uncharacterized membrane protein (Fun14 family)
VGKRVEVEIIARRAVGRNWVADLIWANNRSVSCRIGIGLVSGYAVGWSQVCGSKLYTCCFEVMTWSILGIEPVGIRRNRDQRLAIYAADGGG